MFAVVKGYYHHIAVYPPPIHGPYKVFICCDNQGMVREIFRGIVMASG